MTKNESGSPLYLSGHSVPLTFGSLFTGAGGADLGLERAGMVGLWGCEVDKKCQDVLRFNRPQTPIYTDVRTFPVQAVPVPDVLWMSPPCQDLSVAGKRAGLAGERSGLFYEATRIAMGLRDRGLRWVLMEQVPGLFSSNGGEDLRQALYELLDLGGSLAWRVLDSQWFGVPQRRRRAFFVVDLRGKRAAEVLAVAQGLRGDSAPSREAGQVSATLFASGAGTSRPAGCASEPDFLIPLQEVGKRTGSGGMGQNGCGIGNEGDPMFSLLSSAQHGIAFGLDADYNGNAELVNAMKAAGQGAIRNGAVAFLAKGSRQTENDLAPTLDTGGGGGIGSGLSISTGMAVRRLTPRECERLQGWGDDMTRWGTRENGMTYELADGPRYKMAGNGVTANVSAWIARNLIEADSLSLPTYSTEQKK